MKIEVTQAVPLWVFSMIYKVRDTYLANLRNKVLYQAKLDNLFIQLEVSETKSTGGQCDNIFGTDSIAMKLCLNPKQGEKFCSFVIAHEFAHLLCLNISDCYGISGKAGDGSTNMTAIRRFCPDGTGYAEYFEELNADFIAHIVTAQMDYPDKNGEYESFREATKKQNEIVKIFEDIFGASLCDSDFIDAVFIDGEPVGNYYWDSIMSFSFDNIIDLYDSTMGKGTFRELMDKIDEYFEAEHFSETYDIVRVLSLQNKIFDTVKRFSVAV